MLKVIENVEVFVNGVIGKESDTKCNIFQYPTGNFPSCTEFWEFFPNFPEFSRNFKFGNFRFIFGTETGRELALPHGGTEKGPGRG